MFCIKLRECSTSHKPEGWPCTHTYTRTHTRERTDAENKLCLLNCPSEDQVQEITVAVKEENNGTDLFLSVKTIWSKWKKQKATEPAISIVVYFLKDWRHIDGQTRVKIWQKKKNPQKSKNSYTALKMEFAINVSQDLSLQNQWFPHSASVASRNFWSTMHGFLWKKKKKFKKIKKKSQNTDFFLFKNNKVLVR